MKYRTVYRKDTLTVLTVIEDNSNTITSVPDVNHFYSVEDDLIGVRDALLACSYDVTVLQDFIDALP